MKLDITTHMNSFLDSKVVEKYQKRKNEVFQQLDQAYILEES